MVLITVHKTIHQKEEVIITGYDIASRMEFRADKIHPLGVMTQNLMEN